jgi:hypothetical protein
MSSHSHTLSWYRANQSLLFLLNAACIISAILGFNLNMNFYNKIQYFMLQYIFMFEQKSHSDFDLVDLAAINSVIL